MAEMYNTDRVVGVRLLGGPTAGNSAQVEVTGVGGVNAAAYSDATGAANGTIIALLKGIYKQNAEIIALLTQIESNTDGS